MSANIALKSLAHFVKRDRGEEDRFRYSSYLTRQSEKILFRKMSSLTLPYLFHEDFCFCARCEQKPVPGDIFVCLEAPLVTHACFVMFHICLSGLQWLHMSWTLNFIHAPSSLGQYIQENPHMVLPSVSVTSAWKRLLFGSKISDWFLTIQYMLGFANFLAYSSLLVSITV